MTTIGIDASNIRDGGGITHLFNILNAANPQEQSVEKVIVWGGKNTIEKLPTEKLWLRLVHEPLLDRSLPARLYWQQFILSRLASKNCDILFCPGGLYTGSFKPAIVMSQNMLPFEFKERSRYGFSYLFLRLSLLKMCQSRSFINSSGAIFLTNYAYSEISSKLPEKLDNYIIIPHGVQEKFFLKPRQQKPLNYYSFNNPFKLLYVSIIDLYKHQWHIAYAVAELRQQGIPVEIHLIGSAYQPALRRLYKTMRILDPNQEFIYYHGKVSYDQIERSYHKVDGFVFTSSCENMPNILLEAMASGLPIVCSNRGPMSEILDNAGLYCDPENSSDIAKAIKTLLNDPELRTYCAKLAFERANLYSWSRCANETFQFIKKIADSEKTPQIC